MLVVVLVLVGWCGGVVTSGTVVKPKITEPKLVLPLPLI